MRQDLRVIRTEEDIRTAFHALLAERPVEEITVAQLAERARISRRGFYFHYPSLQALVLSLQEEYLDGLISSMRRHTLPAQLQECVAAYYAFREEDAQYGERLLDYGGRTHVENLLADKADGLVWEEKGLNTYAVTLRKQFLLFGLNEMYIQWKRDGKVFTREEITDISCRILGKGAQAGYDY